MIDTQTSNKSFIHIWRMFQDLNIDNNSFMLELKDESLQGFNMNDLDKLPEDKRNEMMRKVIAECKNNIWFFFREVVRIGNPVSNDLHFHENDSKFILTPYSALLIYLYIKKKSCITAPSPANKRYGLTTTLHLLSMYDYHILEKSENVKLLEFDNYPIDNNIINLYLSNIRIFPIMDYKILKIKENEKWIDKFDNSVTLSDEYIKESNLYGVCKAEYPYTFYKSIKQIIHDPTSHLYLKIGVDVGTTGFKSIILPSLEKIKKTENGDQIMAMLIDYSNFFYDEFILEFGFNNETLKMLLDGIEILSSNKIILII